MAIRCDLERADVPVTTAPAELGDHTKALADAAKIPNRLGLGWTMHAGDFDASDVGLHNGDLELQKRLTRALLDLPDGPEREALMRRAKNLLVAYMPFKVHRHSVRLDRVQPNLQGWWRHPFMREHPRCVDIVNAPRPP